MKFPLALAVGIATMTMISGCGRWTLVKQRGYILPVAARNPTSIIIERMVYVPPANDQADAPDPCGRDPRCEGRVWSPSVPAGGYDAVLFIEAAR
jgi:hypothetical protein